MIEHVHLNFSEVLTIVFGITGGILTLIGLIAIFVSINSQHTLEKLREILWDLKTIVVFDDFLQTKTKSEFSRKFWLYRDLSNGSDKITNTTVKLSKMIIVLVGAMWISLLFYIYFLLQSLEYIYVTIITLIGIGSMFSFIKLLSTLTQINKLSGLPSPEELLDLKNPYIDTTRVLSHNLHFIWDNGSILIELNEDYRNVEISFIELTARKHTSKSERLFEELLVDFSTQNIKLDIYNRVGENLYVISQGFESFLSDPVIENADYIEIAVTIYNTNLYTNLLLSEKPKPRYQGLKFSPHHIIISDKYRNMPFKVNTLQQLKWINLFSREKLRLIQAQQTLPPKLESFNLTLIYKLTKNEILNLPYMTLELFELLLKHLEQNKIKLKEEQTKKITPEYIIGITINIRAKIKLSQRILFKLLRKDFFLALRNIRVILIPIEKLELSIRSYNCLKRAGIYTVGELIFLSTQEISDIKYVGEKSLKEIEEKLFLFKAKSKNK